MNRFASILLLFSTFAGALYAVEGDGAEISYADGEGFTLVQGGTKRYYDVRVDDVLGLPLSEGDVVLTEDSTFLEIRLGVGGAIIKVSENTTFTLKNIDAAGDSVVSVVYGRVRAKLEALTSGARFWITGYDTVAGVRGTDLGYDLFYDRATEGSDRITTVYCFDGSVEVLQPGAPGASQISKLEISKLSPVVVKNGQMVEASSGAPTEPLVPRDIDQDIVDYWGLYPFVSGAVVAAATLETSPELSLEQATKKERYERGGKALFASGVLLFTSGALLLAFSPSTNNAAQSASIGLMAVGGAAILTGGGFVIASTTIK